MSVKLDGLVVLPLADEALECTAGFRAHLYQFFEQRFELARLGHGLLEGIQALLALCDSGNVGLDFRRNKACQFLLLDLDNKFVPGCPNLVDGVEFFLEPVDEHRAQGMEGGMLAMMPSLVPGSVCGPRDDRDEDAVDDLDDRQTRSAQEGPGYQSQLLVEGEGDSVTDQKDTDKTEAQGHDRAP